MNPRNIFAVMSDAAYSVQVRFLSEETPNAQRGKVYDYVTTIPGIKVGDYAIVQAPDFAAVQGQELKIPKTVLVVSVDKEVTFNPMDTKAYGWIVGVVDYTLYNEIQAAVEQAANDLRKAQRSKMREQFKQQFLTALASPVAPAPRPTMFSDMEDEQPF